MLYVSNLAFRPSYQRVLRYSRSRQKKNFTSSSFLYKTPCLHLVCNAVLIKVGWLLACCVLRATRQACPQGCNLLSPLFIPSLGPPPLPPFPSLPPPSRRESRLSLAVSCLPILPTNELLKYDRLLIFHHLTPIGLLIYAGGKAFDEEKKPLTCVRTIVAALVCHETKLSPPRVAVLHRNDKFVSTLMRRRVFVIQRTKRIIYINRIIFIILVESNILFRFCLICYLCGERYEVIRRYTLKKQRHVFKYMH